MNSSEAYHVLSPLEIRTGLLNLAQDIYEQKKDSSNVRTIGNRALHGGPIVVIAQLDMDHVVQLTHTDRSPRGSGAILPSLNLEVISCDSHTRERYYRLIESPSALIQWGYGQTSNTPLVTSRHPEALDDIHFLLSQFTLAEAE